MELAAVSTPCGWTTMEDRVVWTACVGAETGRDVEASRNAGVELLSAPSASSSDGITVGDLDGETKAAGKGEACLDLDKVVDEGFRGEGEANSR